MIAEALVISTAFQLTSAVASVGRVKTASYVASRRFNALALGAVACDFCSPGPTRGTGSSARTWNTPSGRLDLGPDARPRHERTRERWVTEIDRKGVIEHAAHP